MNELQAKVVPREKMLALELVAPTSFDLMDLIVRAIQRGAKPIAWTAAELWQKQKHWTVLANADEVYLWRAAAREFVEDGLNLSVESPPKDGSYAEFDVCEVPTHTALVYLIRRGAPAVYA